MTAIKTAIPRDRKVEWPGGGLETDNHWLAASLDKAQSSESNTTKRADLLNGIDERLIAISETIGELETAVAANRTKDEDKQKLAEIQSVKNIKTARKGRKGHISKGCSGSFLSGWHECFQGPVLPRQRLKALAR